MPNFLNKITFLDSSGQEITLNADNTHSSSVVNAPGTVPLRDNTNRFQVGNTDVSSTDGYIVMNKNYVDGRINALDKSDSSVTGQFVSAVSETNGIISVSRRAIVDSDGAVLKTGDQTIAGIKTFTNYMNVKGAINIDNDATENQLNIKAHNESLRLYYNDNYARGLYDTRSNKTPIVFNSSNAVAGDFDILTCANTPATNTDVVRYADLINMIYWVGIIIETTNPADPSTFLPGTTWELFGAGRVTVGYDANDNDFKTVGGTGGSKYLQAHTHTMTPSGNISITSNPSFTGDRSFTEDAGSHSHYTSLNVDYPNGGDQEWAYQVQDHQWDAGAVRTPSTSVAPNHAHAFTPSGSISGGSYSFSGSQGTTSSYGDGSTENLQPYIVVYRWRRTG